jgi:hypothetical protein
LELWRCWPFPLAAADQVRFQELFEMPRGKSVAFCTMEFLDNEAICNTWLVSKRVFFYHLKKKKIATPYTHTAFSGEYIVS